MWRRFEEVADLVHGGAAAVERPRRGAGGAERLVEHDDAVGVLRPARELGVAEQPAAERAHPQVELVVGIDGRDLVLDGVVGAEALGLVSVRRTSPSVNSIFESPASDFHGSGTFAKSSLQRPEVAVEHVDLALHLLVGDVLLVGAVHDVDDHVDREQLAHGLDRPPALEQPPGLLLDLEPALAVAGLRLDQQLVHDHLRAGAGVHTAASFAPATSDCSLPNAASRLRYFMPQSGAATRLRVYGSARSIRAVTVSARSRPRRSPARSRRARSSCRRAAPGPRDRARPAPSRSRSGPRALRPARRRKRYVRLWPGTNSG